MYLVILLKGCTIIVANQRTLRRQGQRRKHRAKEAVDGNSSRLIAVTHDCGKKTVRGGRVLQKRNPRFTVVASYRAMIY